VEEYLHTSYKPACEYRDGVLTQKPTPTWNHSPIQFRVNYLIEERFSAFAAGPELTVRLREGRYLVPDVAVQSKDRDPDKRMAWEFSRERGLHEVPADGLLTADPITIPLAAVFAVLG
jgi:Uma2 family endonuclease